MKNRYIKKRQELMNSAENLLNDGKVAEAKAVREEIEQLDKDFENTTKEMANLAAMKDKGTILDISNKSLEVKAIGTAGEIPLAIDQPKNDADLYKNAFAKNMMGLPLAKEELEIFDRINTEFRNTVQTTATHTILVPETVKAGIWQEIGESHPIIGDIIMTFVKGDLTILKETTSGDDGKWYDEPTEVGEDDTGFGDLNLTGCELAKDITVSWKLKKMSIDAFLAYITKKIAEKMGNALAKAIVEGKGKPGGTDTFKPEPKGIAVALEAEASTPQIITYATAEDINYKKMTSAMAKIKSGYFKGAAIYAKNDMIWNVLANIVDEIGRPMFVPDVSAGGVGRLFGLPVKEEDGVSANEILIGNVSQGYVINVNENMTMYMEDHVKARKTDYMGYAIIDGDVLTTKAFVLIKKSA